MSDYHLSWTPAVPQAAAEDAEEKEAAKVQVGKGVMTAIQKIAFHYIKLIMKTLGRKGRK